MNRGRTDSLTRKIPIWRCWYDVQESYPVNFCFTMFFQFVIHDFLILVSELIATPAITEYHSGDIGALLVANRRLSVRSAMQDLTESDPSSSGDISIFEDSPETLPKTILPEGPEGDLALFDNEYNKVSGQQDQDSGSLNLPLDPLSGSFSEVASSCLQQPEDNLDSFIDDDYPTVLTGRNLIDDYFDLRIPEDILSAPQPLCIDPQDRKTTSPRPTIDSGLPFPFPSRDFAGKRCRVDLGESPLYALCCYMVDSEHDKSEANACYPGGFCICCTLFLVSFPVFVLDFSAFFFF